MKSRNTKTDSITSSPKESHLSKVTTDLKSSLMYSLSLGDKELFHSNFICWLCDNYKKQMFEVFSEYLDKSNGSKEIIGCEREVNKIDITIHFDKADLYIENKMKSLPSKEQLERYDNLAIKNAKDIKPYFLLLSLVEANFETGNWKKLSYKKFASKLSNIVTKIKHPDKDTNMHHIVMLKDYISMINNITKLTGNFNLNISNTFQETLDLFPISQFEETKLYSLFLRNIYQQIADKLHDKIISSSNNPYDKICRNKRKDIENELTINDGIFYGRKGQIYVRYFFKNGIHLFLALDGKNYQKGVFCNDVKDINKVNNTYKRLLKNNKWMGFNDITPKFIVPPKKKRKDILTFEKGRYKYKYVELNTIIPIKEIIKIMFQDIIKMKDVFKK